jgi:hypothetical protein
MTAEMGLTYTDENAKEYSNELIFVFQDTSTLSSEREVSCKTPIMVAVACPLGKRSLNEQSGIAPYFSRMITCLRSGTAKNTPKNATPILQMTKRPYPKSSGPPSSGSNSFSKAGIIPTNPAPTGSVPTATATVWTRTFSTGEKGYDKCTLKALNTANPRSDNGRLIILIHPVCNPKYELEKHARVPMTRPTIIALRVSCCPSTNGIAGVGSSARGSVGSSCSASEDKCLGRDSDSSNSDDERIVHLFRVCLTRGSTDAPAASSLL